MLPFIACVAAPIKVISFISCCPGFLKAVDIFEQKVVHMIFFGQISTYGILFWIIGSAHSFLVAVTFTGCFQLLPSCPEFLHLCLVKCCCFLSPEITYIRRFAFWIPSLLVNLIFINQSHLMLEACRVQKLHVVNRPLPLWTDINCQHYQASLGMPTTEIRH